MIKISELKETDDTILVVGNHRGIIQSILDFDYLSGKQSPSIEAIISNIKGVTKYFWGREEILIPNFANLDSIPQSSRFKWFLNMSSGRRVLSEGKELIAKLPNLLGGTFFAENVPEAHSIELYKISKANNLLLVGPATVGLLVPGLLKLGAIGGLTGEQIYSANLIEKGSVAVMSASGGMTNELINLVRLGDMRLSFAISFGGDRFPIFTPEDAFLLAEKDKNTKVIIYYGELGGYDEYNLLKLKEKEMISKPVIAHIGGTVAELFPGNPQFGHAKAKASKDQEKAKNKRLALREAGFHVSESFKDIGEVLKKIKN